MLFYFYFDRFYFESLNKRLLTDFVMREINRYLIIYYLLIYLNIMSDQRKSDDESQSIQKKEFKKQNSLVKTEDLSSKLFYSTPIIPNIPTKFNEQPAKQNYQWQNQNPSFGNYYMPMMYPPTNQFSGNQMQQMLNSMYIALGNQSKLLCELVQKNEQNIKKTCKIYEQMLHLKKQQSSENQNHAKATIQKPKGDDITATDLINILYDSKNNFKYSLVMDKEFSLDKILYRERNFQLKINLVDQNGAIYSNSNKIPISLALYTVENPPKFLESNTLGNKMLKGHTQQDLLNGSCFFQKIQIKQVTSHYRKGMLFLVAFSKMPSFGATVDSKFVDYTLIRPLVIDKVVVKAKKMKEQNVTTKEGNSQGKIKEKDSENCEGEQVNK